MFILATEVYIIDITMVVGCGRDDLFNFKQITDVVCIEKCTNTNNRKKYVGIRNR